MKIIKNKSLVELNNFHPITSYLYEHKDSTILYSLPKILSAKSGVDLRGLDAETVHDIAKICKMYRDDRFETFRFIYLKNNKIVGSQGITSKLPASSPAVPYFNRSSSQENVRAVYFYKHKMEKSHADSYFIVHNHPSGSSSPSDEDLLLTKVFQNNIPGFKGHIILGRNTFTVVDSDVSTYTYDNLQLNSEIKVSDQTELANLLNDTYIKDSSVVVYTDSSNTVTSVEELQNSAFKDDFQVWKYIQNQAVDNRASNVFLYTDNYEIYTSAKVGMRFGVFRDAVLAKDNYYYFASGDPDDFSKTNEQKYYKPTKKYNIN